MIKDIWLLRTEKKNGNKGDLFGTHSVTVANNSLKTDKCMTAIATQCAANQRNQRCTLCRDGSHTFVSFQTVICFCDRVSSEISPLFPFFFFSPRQPYIFYHIVINDFAILVIIIRVW